MKILLVNFSDLDGGAAKATYRLHRALLNEGISSQMLVQIKSSDDHTVLAPESNLNKLITKIQGFINPLPLRKYKPIGPFSTLFSPSLYVVDRINKINPDVVHLHWINAGMLQIEDLEKINAPIVWTLHDNWAFTGGCHIMLECEKYKHNCGACPQLQSTKEHDISRKIWNRKKKAFSNLHKLTIVGVSNWITNCSKVSTLLKDKKHICLPNLINTTVFKPFNKEQSRLLWNLPKDKKLVLFGATKALSDKNKGFKELSEALENLKDLNIELVVFGGSALKESKNFMFKTHYIGSLHDEVSLVTLYSAVDVMVVPSRQESFGQTASEAMSCATPVVAFGHTGLLDIIDHKNNGYLAEPFESSDLLNGIEWVLNSDNYEELCKNARNKVLAKFDSQVISSKFIELYDEIINSKYE